MKTLILNCFKLIAIIIAITLVKNIRAQNLVDNSSFEDIISCPNNLIQTNKIKGWIINVNSADYYNSCASNFSGVSVPKNYFGYQVPATGNAYCGLYFYIKTPIGDVREYLGRRLSSPLITNKKYYASFKVSWADGWCATNKLGALFSNKYYGDSTSWGIEISPPPLVNNFAHIYTDSIITDSVNWTTISGSFIADSAYQYIYIGNFFNRANTDTLWFLGGLPDCKSYYYIDDVCVSIDSATCYKSASIKDLCEKSKFNIFPNPSTGKFIVKADFEEFQKIDLIIFNSFGEIIKQFINEKKDAVFDISQYSKGFYILKITIPNKNYYQKLIIY